MSQWKGAGICLVVLFALLLTACGGGPGTADPGRCGQGRITVIE